MNDAWPIEIRLKDQGHILLVRFEGDESYSYAAEFLRVESPSAEVKGHGAGQEVTVSGKKAVRVERVEPVGNYAIRLVFSDRHATGIYTWPYLLDLGRNYEKKWNDYLARLQEKGLSREQ
jgi:DUF971 family protein